MITGGVRHSICTISSEKEGTSNHNQRRSILKTPNTLDVNLPNQPEMKDANTMSKEIQLDVVTR